MRSPRAAAGHALTASDQRRRDQPRRRRSRARPDRATPGRSGPPARARRPPARETPAPAPATRPRGCRPPASRRARPPTADRWPSPAAALQCGAPPPDRRAARAPERAGRARARRGSRRRRRPPSPWARSRPARPPPPKAPARVGRRPAPPRRSPPPPGRRAAGAAAARPRESSGFRPARAWRPGIVSTSGRRSPVARYPTLLVFAGLAAAASPARSGRSAAPRAQGPSSFAARARAFVRAHPRLRIAGAVALVLLIASIRSPPAASPRTFVRAGCRRSSVVPSPWATVVAASAGSSSRI